MKKHRKISRTEALGMLASAATVPLKAQPVNSSYDTRGLKDFQRDWDAAEKEKVATPVKAAVTEQSRLLRQLIDVDSATLCSAPSSFLTATTPQVGDGAKF